MKQVFKLCLLPSFLGFFFCVRVFFFLRGGGGGGLTGIRGKQICRTSCLRHAVLVIIPQLGGSLQGFALFHIKTVELPTRV